MPRYYLHVRRGQITILDQEGIELADAVDAEVEAAQRAQGIANGEAKNGATMDGPPGSRGTIIVADDNWQKVFELPF